MTISFSEAGRPMRTRMSLAVAGLAVLVSFASTGCSIKSSGSTDVGGSSGGPVILTGEAAPSDIATDSPDEAETSTATSASAPSYGSGEYSLTTADGYTFDIAFQIDSLQVNLDTANAVPGETLVSLEVNGTYEVTNTTAGKNIPGDVVNDWTAIYAVFPSTSGMCLFPGSNLPGDGLQPLSVTNYLTGSGATYDQYCVLAFFVGSLTEDLAADTTASGQVSLTIWAGMEHSVPAETANAVASAATEPPLQFIGGRKFVASLQDDDVCAVEGDINLATRWASTPGPFDPSTCTVT